jgi:hypothetical protein
MKDPITISAGRPVGPGDERLTRRRREKADPELGDRHVSGPRLIDRD